MTCNMIYHHTVSTNVIVNHKKTVKIISKTVEDTATFDLVNQSLAQLHTHIFMLI